MPLVRIDIRKNDDPLFAKNIGEVIYRALRAAMNVPDKDNFQILNEHDAAHFIYDPPTSHRAYRRAGLHPDHAQ